MHEENVQALLQGAAGRQQGDLSGQLGYTGSYKKHVRVPPKPAYSTFAPRGKPHDGTNGQFFHQRDAVIGKLVADSVEPSRFMKKGGGVRATVPPQSHDKIATKPPLDNINKEYDNFLLRSTARGDGSALSACRDGAALPNSSGRNYVQANIAEASSTTSRREPKPVVMATSRKDFAQVPAYLARVNREIAAERECVQSVQGNKRSVQDSLRAQHVFRLDEKEREEMMRLLRVKFDAKSTAYNRLPLSNSNPTVHRQKVALEKAIDEIEMCMRKLDRAAIFVYKDDPANAEWTKAAAMQDAREFAASQM